MPSITLTTPQDIIAAVPYLLGYYPSDSLVVIAATARRAVVMLRYELPAPADRDRADDLADHLTAALARYQADEVALLGYGTVGQARPVLTAAIAALSDLLTIREALLVTGPRFWSLTCEQCCPPGGIEIDSPATALAAQLTARGLAPYPSRDAMLAAIEPVGGAAAQAMRSAVTRATTQLQPIGPGGPDGRHLAQLRELLAKPVPLTDADAARLIVLLANIRLRDEAWAITNVGDPDTQVAFWADLTRRAPGRYAAPPASILAYAAACLAGNSTLARAATGRALAANPRYLMARIIQRMLDADIPPSRCRVRITAADLPAIPGPADS